MSPGSRAQHPRLLPSMVRDIFLARTSDSMVAGGVSCESLAKKYSQTPRTILNICNARTYCNVTKHLWTDVDCRKALDNVLCPGCVGDGVSVVTAACDVCQARYHKRVGTASSSGAATSSSAAPDLGVGSTGTSPCPQLCQLFTFQSTFDSNEDLHLMRICVDSFPQALMRICRRCRRCVTC